jgi:hypothetical protein
MKKKMYVVGMAVLVASLLALPGVAQAAMWVGAELGGNFNAPMTFRVNGTSVGDTYVQPSVIGGATIGYDFVNSGFGAYAWPDWMKYFSVATDITYNRLVAPSSAGGLANAFPGGSRFNGYEIAWTFLAMAHYGFLPDSEVPGGRINPYIGVGPAVVFSGGDYTIPVNILQVNQAWRINPRHTANSTNIALVVEPGIRWVALPQVSIDTAFRYRYMAPSWGGNVYNLSTTVNQFAFLVRANYHF